MSSIKPSIGRVVLVRLTGVNMGSTPDQQPLPALISYIWSDTMINVGGFNSSGSAFAAASIRLIPSDEPLPELPSTESFAHWMPYQIESAAKVEEKQIHIGDAAGIPVEGTVDESIPRKL